MILIKEYKKEYLKKYYEDNKEKKKKYYEDNKEKKREYREANKDKIKEVTKKYREANKEKLKEYYKNNKEKIKEYKKEYSKANKDKAKEYYQGNKEKINERHRIRRNTEPLYKMKCNLRSRTTLAFKSKGYKKSSKTRQMLGVDWEICKAHIERQFTKGMNWKNQGEWHIDHIIPLADAKNENELKKLCHYSNIQPLWASENLIKSDKIIGQQTKIRL